MNTIRAGNHDFLLYGSIKELPMNRYKVMQQYLLQEAGIGSSVADLDERLSKVISLMSADKKDEAVEELTNFRYSFFSAISGLDFKTMAFSCLVAQIDGQPREDLSTEGLGAIVSLLSDLTPDELSEHWEHIKKKLIPNSELISQDGLEMTLNTLKT